MYKEDSLLSIDTVTKSQPLLYLRCCKVSTIKSARFNPVDSLSVAMKSLSFLKSKPFKQSPIHITESGFSDNYTNTVYYGAGWGIMNFINSFSISSDNDTLMLSIFSFSCSIVVAQ
jgi:hypothetical protein